MRLKLIIFLSLTLVSALLGYASFQYENFYLQKVYHTCLAMSIIYCAFKLLLEEYGIRRISESKSKYLFRRAISITYPILIIATIIAIWVANLQALLVSYGIVGAGIAIALQDVFKNLAGGITIYLTGMYRVGDRIQVRTKCGDVADIGMLYTTLLEIEEWVAGNQPTGRLSVIPNSYVLSDVVNNYTKDHEFLWDEITIPITYDSNWKQAVSKILMVVKAETQEISKQAEKSLSDLASKYYLDRKATEPAIFVKLTDNWISLYVRYITTVKNRRLLHNKLNQSILDEIQKSGDITISSATLSVKVSTGNQEPS